MRETRPLKRNMIISSPRSDLSKPGLLGGYEEAVHGHGECVEAEGQHAPRGGVEVPAPEI